METIVEIKGHQYKVHPGDLIDVQLMDTEEGQSIDFDQVLFVGGENPVVGKPTVNGAKVTAKVLGHDRSRKIVVLKRSPGKYQRKNGHRQNYTSLLITGIDNGNGNQVEIAADHVNAKKYLK